MHKCAMNDALKIDDKPCRQARRRAVNADLSFSKWLAQLSEKEIESPKVLKEKTMAELLGAEDRRGFEEFLPDRKADLERAIQFP